MDRPSEPACAGKIFPDGRVIRVAQRPDWQATSNNGPPLPAGIAALSVYQQAMWVLEASPGATEAQHGTYVAYWAKRV